MSDVFWKRTRVEWLLYSPMYRWESDEELPWHTKLGVVSPRKDGRWDWWRKPLTGAMGRVPRWTCVEHGQGVADTLDLAKARVEDLLCPEKLCERKACRQPRACYYNPSTRAFYCVRCARKINESNPGLCVLKG